ncbi:MAG: hypothetical protein E7350_02860 [Clostridiales bacterium]|nr:hypothetical protein [Clostridiales bacterium]
MKKFFGFIIAIAVALTVGFTFKIASGDFDAKQSTVVAADTVANEGMTFITQTDALGKEVQIEVTHDTKNGRYVMIDETRNIFLQDLHNGEEMTGEYLSIKDDGSESFEDIAVSAWSNMLKIYDFYAEGGVGEPICGVDGGNNDKSGDYDLPSDTEFVVIVCIHYGRNYNNAYCSPDIENKTSYVVIGDGGGWGGTLDRPARALDVLGHEYQHALTKYYAGMEYEGESGAIDEAISDIMGSVIEGKTGDDFWNICEDGVNTRYGDNLRSSIGGTRNQRYSLAEKYVCAERGHGTGRHTQDGCDYNGVHYNSTILTHMQYNIWSEMPEYFTNERIGKLWFDTMRKLDINSDFNDFAEKFLLTAIEQEFSAEAINTMVECMQETGFDIEAPHTVTFVDYDGTELASYTVRDGEQFDEEIPTPSREDTAQYDYTFVGWDMDIPSVITEDIVLTAQYEQVVLQYTVTIINMIGTVISEEDYDYGTEFDLVTMGEPTFLGEKWTFVGYFADEQHSSEVQSLTLTEDITLYAYWEYEQPSTQPDDGGEEEAPEETPSCGTVAAPPIGGNNGGGGLMIGLAAAAVIAVVAVFAKKKQKN